MSLNNGINSLTDLIVSTTRIDLNDCVRSGYIQIYTKPIREVVKYDDNGVVLTESKWIIEHK